MPFYGSPTPPTTIYSQTHTANFVTSPHKPGWGRKSVQIHPNSSNFEPAKSVWNPSKPIKTAFATPNSPKPAYCKLATHLNPSEPSSVKISVHLNPFWYGRWNSSTKWLPVLYIVSWHFKLGILRNGNTAKHVTVLVCIHQLPHLSVQCLCVGLANVRKCWGKLWVAQ